MRAAERLEQIGGEQLHELRRVPPLAHLPQARPLGLVSPGEEVPGADAALRVVVGGDEELRGGLKHGRQVGCPVSASPAAEGKPKIPRQSVLRKDPADEALVRAVLAAVAGQSTRQAAADLGIAHERIAQWRAGDWLFLRPRTRGRVREYLRRHRVRPAHRRLDWPAIRAQVEALADLAREERAGAVLETLEEIRRALEG